MVGGGVAQRMAGSWQAPIESFSIANEVCRGGPSEFRIKHSFFQSLFRQCLKASETVWGFVDRPHPSSQGAYILLEEGT